MKEVKSILIAISTLDRGLSWNMPGVLSYYQQSYVDRHSKSMWVNTSDDYSFSLASNA